MFNIINDLIWYKIKNWFKKIRIINTGFYTNNASIILNFDLISNKLSINKWTKIYFSLRIL